MVEDSMRLIRGQVWHWTDPVYGDKQEKRNVNIGESTMRYSRYVVIFQTTDTIDTQSVLVIPCSSRAFYETDCQIPLAHALTKSMSYTRPRRIFPVHPKTLDSYICTLSTQTMRELEAEVIRLMLPDLMACLDHNVLKDAIGLDLDQAEERAARSPIITQYNINELVAQFVKEHIVKKKGHKETLLNIKLAYDKFCLINGIEPLEDMLTFLGYFTHAMRYGTNKNAPSSYATIEFTGIRIKEPYMKTTIPHPIVESVPEILVEPAEEVQPPAKVTQTKPASNLRWTTDEKKRFLDYLEKHGVEATSKEFNLKPSTVPSYRNQFRLTLNISKHEEQIYKTKQIQQKKEETKSAEVITFPLNSLIESISKFSNLIKADMECQKVFDYSHTYSATSNKLKPEHFYKQLGSGIYYSFFDLLDLTEVNLCKVKASSQTPSKIDQYADTIKILDAMMKDSEFRNIEDGGRFMSLYRRKYGSNGGIDVDWLFHLEDQLSDRLNLVPKGVEQIISLIKSAYCHRGQLKALNKAESGKG